MNHSSKKIDVKEESVLKEKTHNDPLMKPVIGEEGITNTTNITSTPVMTSSFKTAEYIKKNSGYEYSYFVIASPQVRRRMSEGSIPERSSSFISNASVETSSSNSPTPLQTTNERNALTKNSKSILQTLKFKLQNEIEKIDMEISRMETEKLLILNLRNTVMKCRRVLDQVERNKQSIPIAEKMRFAVTVVSENLQCECSTLNGDVVIPYLDYVTTELNEGIAVSKVIINNKASLIIDCLEELYVIIGKLFGMVESIMLLYYDDENLDSLDGLEETNVQCLTVTQALTARESSIIYNKLSEDQLTNTSERSPSEVLNESELQTNLKVFLHKINKVKRVFHVVERLSAGNPKTKTVLQCFKEIQKVFRDTFPMDERNEVWLQELNENISHLKTLLSTSRPGEKELEKCKAMIGELWGRVTIIVKSSQVTTAR